MDGGSHRAPRPAQRVVNRSSAPQHPPQAPAAKVEPQAVHRTFAAPQNLPQEENSLVKRLILPVIVGIVALVLGVVAGNFVSNGRNPGTGTAIDDSKYQAVFFTNGQVYFGKLQAFNKDYMKLNDIYYLQTQTTGDTDPENPQQTATDQKNVQLIKLGDEIHGPQDEMIIAKEQMLFFENLKPEGKVSQSIEQFKQ